MQASISFPLRQGALRLALTLLFAAHLNPGQGIAAGPPPLREFAYRSVTLSVLQADGKVSPGISVYGFCSNLNLVCPRRDKELEGRNDVLWDESYLGKTTNTGSLNLVIPPGKWGFFAAGLGSDGTVLAAWTDFRERSAGERILLRPTLRKRWVGCAAEGTALPSKQLFLKPEGFPIWIPVTRQIAAESFTVAMPSGNLRIWGTGDGTSRSPGFALSWGTVNPQTAEGPLLAPKAAVLNWQGGQARASMSWYRQREFGLEGAIALKEGSQVLFHSRPFTLSYQRPVARQFMADFVGEFYNMETEAATNL